MNHFLDTVQAEISALIVSIRVKRGDVVRTGSKK